MKRSATPSAEYSVMEDVERCGVPNLGNSCYLSSVIVALAASNQTRKAINQAAKSVQTLKTSFVVKALHEALGNRSRNVISNLIRRVHRDMKFGVSGNSQEDAHELFVFLVHAIEEQFLADLKAKSESSVRNWMRLMLLRIKLDFGEEPPYFPSEFHPFRGLLRSDLKFPACRHERVPRFSYFTTISLPVFFDRSCTLDQCLVMFAAEEQIEDVICSECKCKQKAFKKVSVSRLPSTLVFHFNRALKEKSNVHIEFPETLPWSSIDRLMSNVSVSSSCLGTYRLSSVITHTGSISSGHYSIYHKSISQQEWLYTSDSIVRSVGLHSVLACQAYMLFYERCFL